MANSPVQAGIPSVVGMSFNVSSQTAGLNKIEPKMEPEVF
jgi:hypothetical protein